LRALELSEKLGDVCGEALAYGLLGDAYLGLGRYEEAAAVLLRALPVFRRHSSRRFHAVCLLKLGYTYEAMRSSEAIGYLEESIRLFTEIRQSGKADQARHALDRCRIALAAS
jgi:tetratricopeptide (TPR) repeat protein